MAIHHDPTATTYLKRSTMDRFIVTVDRNDRTVTPKFRLNRRVLRRCMHSSWISIKLTCLDTIHSFLLIPSSSSFISASMEGLKSRFGGESKEKSPLEAGRDALDVFGD